MIYRTYLILLTGLITLTVYGQRDTVKMDSLLLQNIQDELQKQTTPIQPRVAVSANPDISVIGDFRGHYQSFGKRNIFGGLNEAEFSFQSVVDPYLRADFFYGVGQDFTTGKFESEIEEGYLSTLSLPAHLQLKAGRFKHQIGRINPIHSHALSFIELPDPYIQFFGNEGLRGDGISINWLLPNRSFFQELSFEISDVTDNPSFIRSERNHFLYLAHLKNFWDLTDNATLQFGLTGMSGENKFRNFTQIAALDLTYKWKPVQFNTYKSLTFQNEFYYSHANLDTAKINSIGFYSLLNVQVARRHFISARYDFSNSPSSTQFRQQSGVLTLGFLATEFQKIEFELKYTNMNQALPEYGLSKNILKGNLRWIFVIGTHGAHQY